MISDRNIIVILVNHNNSKLTDNCIQSFPFSENISFIIIDNSSLQNEKNEMRKLVNNLMCSYRIKLLHQENKGFGSACNLGIDKALNEHEENSIIWILNNDTVLISKNVVSFLRNKITNHHTIYGTTQINNQKVLCTGGGKLVKSILDQRQLNYGLALEKLREIKSEKTNKELNFINGGSLIATSNFFKIYGKFKEDYFLYWEDTCYSYNLKANFKVSLKWIPEISIEHFAGSSTDHSSIFTDKLYLKNRIKFYHRYFKINKLQQLYILILFSISKIIRFQFGRAITILRQHE